MDADTTAIDAVQRIAKVVAKLLDLSDAERLTKYAIELMIGKDALQNIYETLKDYNWWDYGMLESTSTYYYAASVVAWLYLYKQHLYKIGPKKCQLFSDEVAAAVVKYLTTYTAEYIGKALQNISLADCQ
jgi:hypothetical protein